MEKVENHGCEDQRNARGILPEAVGLGGQGSDLWASERFSLSLFGQAAEFLLRLHVTSGLWKNGKAGVWPVLRRLLRVCRRWCGINRKGSPSVLRHGCCSQRGSHRRVPPSVVLRASSCRERKGWGTHAGNGALYRSGAGARPWQRGAPGGERSIHASHPAGRRCSSLFAADGDRICRLRRDGSSRRWLCRWNRG